MRTKLSIAKAGLVRLLTAALALAITLTFSCSSGDDGGDGDNNGQPNTTNESWWNGKDLNLDNCIKVYDEAYIVCRKKYVVRSSCNELAESEFIIANSKVYRCNLNNTTQTWIPYNSTGTHEYNALTVNDIFNGNDPDPCKTSGHSLTGEFVSKECGELDGYHATVCIPPRQICD